MTEEKNCDCITDERLITIREASVLLQMHISSIYRLLAKNPPLIPYMQIPTKNGRGGIRFRKKDLFDWLRIQPDKEAKK
jgi:predicted DNA-binding transcriptional regulator AlpA